MKVIRGTLKREPSRDNYWTKVVLRSDNQQQTSLFLCASHEYLGSTFKTKNITETITTRWVDDTVKNWESKGASLFKKPFHLDVHAITEEGQRNGINFLQNEVVPKSLYRASKT